jgi:Rieske 2Fe-2S family protein
VGEADYNVTIRSPDDVDQMKFKLYRQPIGLGRSTISRGGTPVAPLMGGFTSFDGGETAMHFGRLCFVGGYNDRRNKGKADADSGCRRDIGK